MNDYQKLEVWQLSKDVCVKVYKLTENFPSKEIYGITNQIRRSSISIASNLAEGSGRRGKRDFLKFVGYAIGSANELETQLIISKELEFISHKDFEELIEELIIIKKMLFNLSKYLNSKL
ncbi:four helix bundle protein [Weeksellaceae bacterium KMM 9724]|uniref:four helix bundle protein n=1 Tax=Profundicola chukchiensis TaxID=2961959 RepID=UPI00243B3F7D|nr:four helix bundle protein [Profundicola chukchiensis]MDG4951481.1 four helix bundle protein [Profundicola chukchiensis]